MKANGEKYIYYQPYCKECSIKKQQDRYFSNPELGREYSRNWAENNKERHKIMKQIWESNNVEFAKELRSVWRKENPDKIKEYNKDRSVNKKHDITEQEWFDCLEFFDYTCAYCGLTEYEQIKLYNERFHKEHVDHTGSNYIDNCIPSCTGCNTSKHTSEFNDWYNSENSNFTQERYDKIVKWMAYECFKSLNLV